MLLWLNAAMMSKTAAHNQFKWHAQNIYKGRDRVVYYHWCKSTIALLQDGILPLYPGGIGGQSPLEESNKNTDSQETVLM